MYITYTFVFGNNLVGLLVLKVLGAVALPMTFLLAVEARDPSLSLGRHLRRDGMMLATLMRGTLWALGLPTGFLEIRSLVDHQHGVLLLDFHLSNLEHIKQLRQGLGHSLHVVVQDKSFIARGQRLQHPINHKFVQNLAF
jgi:hypothetical protein